MRYWLEEAECRDQYSVIFESGDRTSIFWNDVKDPVSIEERAVSVATRGASLCVSLAGAGGQSRWRVDVLFSQITPRHDILRSYGFGISPET